MENAELRMVSGECGLAMMKEQLSIGNVEFGANPRIVVSHSQYSVPITAREYRALFPLHQRVSSSTSLGERMSIMGYPSLRVTELRSYE